MWKCRHILHDIETRIYRLKKMKKNINACIILINAGMKFRIKEEFRYGIPAYTGPFRALYVTVQLTLQ
jgi:hypothetical protein